MNFIKKYSKYIFLFICMFILLENVAATTTTEVGFINDIDQKTVMCNGTEIPYGVPYILHSVVTIIKIGIPIILIILGMIDFLRAVIASDEKQMKESAHTFIRRLIAAILIFFVFVIVQFVFSLVDDDGAFGCVNCIINNECGTVTNNATDNEESNNNTNNNTNNRNI